MFSISTTSGSPSGRLLLLLLLPWLSLQRHLSTDAAESFDSTCKSASEYLDAMYRCRTSDFQVVSFCSSQSPHELECSKSNRIAVFNASIGRSSGDVCSQTTSSLSNRSLASGNADADCCILQLVENKCHGKQRCNLSGGELLQSADGRQCAPLRKRSQQQQQLQRIMVVFICVHQTLIKEMKRDKTNPEAFCDGRLEATSGESRNRQQPVDLFRPETHQPITTDRLPLTKTPELTSAGFGVSGADQSDPTSVYRGGRSLDWLWSMVFIRDNMDRFMIYLFMSIAVGLILVLLVVVFGSCFGRHWRRRNKAKVLVTQSSTQTNDVTSSLVASNHTHGIEMVHYSHTDSLHAAPRSNGNPSLAGNSVHFAPDNSSTYQGMRRTGNGGSTYLNSSLYQINSSADSMDGGGPAFDRIADHDNDYRSNTLGRFYTNPYRHDSYRSDGYRTLQHK